MGEEGVEKNEIIVEPTDKSARPVNNKEEVSSAVESFTLSEEERSRNPDPEETKSSGVVVPSVIRISPNTTNGNRKAGGAESVVRSSPLVPVVRPRASKTPPQEPAAAPNGKPRPSEEAGKASGNASGKEIINQTPKKDEAKRREAQTNFPRRNKPKRMTSGKGVGMAQVDGHTQYSNTAAGARHQHANRQDTHGHRQHHGRGTHGASMTSSAGGTPTMVGRRAPHHPRGLSMGSHASDMDEPSPSVPPATPLFQRLVTEEVQELKAYTRIIEEQNRRVTELERRTADLEKRLQKKDKENADLERTLEYRETGWRNKFDILESDRDHQKELVEQEKRMNTKLNYQVVQMEQEIHKFLTRKVRALCYAL